MNIHVSDMELLILGWQIANKARGLVDERVNSSGQLILKQGKLCINRYMYTILFITAEKDLSKDLSSG